MRRLILLLSIAILALSAACSVMIPSTGNGEAQQGAQPQVTDTSEQEVSEQEVPKEQEAPMEQEAAAGEATQAISTGGAPVDAAPHLNEEQFDAALAQAIEARDFAALRGMMGSSFVLAGWRSEGQALSPDDAIAQMSLGALAPGATPAAAFGVDTAALLEGADPLAFFPPDAVRAFFVDFVGPQAADQALVIVGRDPASGQRYWKGLLVAAMGFRPQDPSGEGDLNLFSEQLAQALQNNDPAAMRALMGSRFSVATLNKSLYEYPADEALAQLRQTVFASGAHPSMRFGTDLVALLGGADPLGQWGPVAQPVKGAHVMGLGQTGGGEAVLVIGRDASGRYYWHGILLPETGDIFQAPAGEPGEPGDAVETSVKTVTALEAVNVRSGPGMNYAVEGRLRIGEVAQVTAKSRDGAWWQILCTQDASGRCWVSADPRLTQP